jgi:hypothetical protein
MLSAKILKEFSHRLLEALDIPVFVYHDTGVSYDKGIVIDHLDEIRKTIIGDLTRSRSVSTALMFMINGINYFFDDSVEQAQQCFENADNVCDEVTDSSKLEDIFLSCRIKLFCRLVLSDYFTNEFCHRYVIGCEMVKIVQQYFDRAPLKVAVDDEFAPLLYPRTFGHTHLTRVPILREISRLNGYLMSTHERHVDVRLSEGLVLPDMKQVRNTAVFRIPSALPSSKSDLRHKKKTAMRKQQQEQGPSSSSLASSSKLKRRMQLMVQQAGRRPEETEPPSSRRVLCLACTCTGEEECHAAPSLLSSATCQSYKMRCLASGMLCAGLEDGRICVFSTRDLTARGVRPLPALLGTLVAPCASSVACMCVVADTLVAGYESGSIVVWDCSSMAILGTQVRGHYTACCSSALCVTSHYTSPLRYSVL